MSEAVSDQALILADFSMLFSYMLRLWGQPGHAPPIIEMGKTPPPQTAKNCKAPRTMRTVRVRRTARFLCAVDRTQHKSYYVMLSPLKSSQIKIYYSRSSGKDLNLKRMVYSITFEASSIFLFFSP